MGLHNSSVDFAADLALSTTTLPSRRSGLWPFQRLPLGAHRRDLPRLVSGGLQQFFTSYTTAFRSSTSFSLVASVLSSIRSWPSEPFQNLVGNPLFKIKTIFSIHTAPGISRTPGPNIVIPHIYFYHLFSLKQSRNRVKDVFFRKKTLFLNGANRSHPLIPFLTSFRFGPASTKT
jgi:hypothetical protein